MKNLGGPHPEKPRKGAWEMISVRGSGGNRKIVIPTSIKVTTPPTKNNIYSRGTARPYRYGGHSGILLTERAKTLHRNALLRLQQGRCFYENIDKINIAWVWEGQVGYSTTQAITVNRVLRSIAITTPPTKTAYNKK